MEKFNRAVRRHHRDRLKAKRKTFWGGINNDEPRRLGMAVATPAICSCWMCGHYRDTEGRTVQEKRWMQPVDEE